MFTADQQIGPYTLIRRIGRGGFGEVWLAERRSQLFSKKLAIKLPHDDQVDLKTISQEAVLWEQASGHPNVLPIIDADVYDGQIVIASEYADGGSLADRVKQQGRPTKEEVIRLGIGILNGLEFLHERKIIHRDIKPQNILIQGNTPRLADFGISRAMQTTVNSSIVAGTDAYMSPESFEGKRSPQTDIWSVGVLLFELVNGSLPFPQEHPSERMYAILTREPIDLDEVQPPMLRVVIGKALEKNQSKRYSTAKEMREHLEWILKDDINLSSAGNKKTVVLDSNISQITIETPRGDLSPDRKHTVGVAPAQSESFERAKPTQLVVPTHSRQDKREPGFLESYSNDLHAGDDQDERGNHTWIYYAVAGGLLLIMLLVYEMVSSGSTEVAKNSAATTPKVSPSASANPTRSPTPSPTMSPSAQLNTNSNNVIDKVPARDGKYSSIDGYLNVSSSSLRGFSFEFRNGFAPKGTGGECKVNGDADWTNGSSAIYPSVLSTQKSCVIKFTFTGNIVKIEGTNCSSFCGPGVSVGGTYTRK